MKIQILPLLLLLLWGIKADAQQRPVYVPFKYNNKTGLMDTTGTLIREPGFAAGYYVAGDFKAYIFIMPEEEHDMVMDAVTAAEKNYGKLDEETGALEDGRARWYHFWKEGRSRLVNIEADHVIELPVVYRKFDATEGRWDNELQKSKGFVFGLKEDNTYELLDAGRGFEKVSTLPPFESYDMVLQTDDSISLLTGYVTGTADVINRRENGIYGISSSPGQVAIYNADFKKLGTAAYNPEAIGMIFGKEVLLRGMMPAPPAVKNRVIRQVHQGREKLNETFSVFERKNPADSELRLLSLEQTTSNGHRPVFRKRMDYRYIGIPGAKNALLQVRDAGSGSFFYFDYNGVFFPKGTPMIPAPYLQDR
ncbi:hypothetical protein [Niabella beijingensis]|uniref:hypothetical protein n=1 Tax=Niabella beijingensis TaxID=2872700 RepID=UPI001CBCCDF5|nr:hypothetical protein [Niabella beijingensis]MBZ4189029.1 hypothetical protein [Niabella beijingensis]